VSALSGGRASRVGASRHTRRTSQMKLPSPQSVLPIQQKLLSSCAAPRLCRRCHWPCILHTISTGIAHLALARRLLMQLIAACVSRLACAASRALSLAPWLTSHIVARGSAQLGEGALCACAPGAWAWGLRAQRASFALRAHTGPLFVTGHGRASRAPRHRRASRAPPASWLPGTWGA
jgi:hypothetical protein